MFALHIDRPVSETSSTQKQRLSLTGSGGVSATSPSALSWLCAQVVRVDEHGGTTTQEQDGGVRCGVEWRSCRTQAFRSL